MSKTFMKVGLGAALGVALIGIGSVAGRALALGIPEVKPLSYTGTLRDGESRPLLGEHAVEIRFWDAASGGGTLCTTGAVNVTLVAGTFSVSLPDECTNAVHARPDFWTEVVVDSVSLGRSKAGAVPFAVEADHARRASEAVRAQHADRAVNVVTATNGAQQRICSGTTTPGETNWDVYGSNLVLHVDTTECGFSATPQYFTTLAGRNHHWTTRGGSNPYSERATEFTVYVLQDNGVTPEAANADEWHIQWLAVGE